MDSTISLRQALTHRGSQVSFALSSVLSRFIWQATTWHKLETAQLWKVKGKTYIFTHSNSEETTALVFEKKERYVKKEICYWMSVALSLAHAPLTETSSGHFMGSNRDT